VFERSCAVARLPSGALATSSLMSDVFGTLHQLRLEPGVVSADVNQSCEGRYKDGGNLYGTRDRNGHTGPWCLGGRLQLEQGYFPPTAQRRGSGRGAEPAHVPRRWGLV
jgi:hypothetical protein